MSITNRLVRRSLHASPVLAMAIATSSAGADVFSLYLDDETHLYVTTGMPDFDQRRDGLAANGDCHCGPASATNLLAFIAMHDAPHVVPFLPETAWNDPGIYDAVTEFIHDFGVAAGTDVSSCSTDHLAMIRGIEAAGDGWVGRNFDVSKHAWDRTSPTSVAPRVREFTGRLAGERAVGIAFRSTWAGTPINEQFWAVSGLEDRRGGHYMTVHSALRAGDISRLLLRNSYEEGGDLDKQSTFENVDYDVTEAAILLGANLKPLDRLGPAFVAPATADRPAEFRQHFFYGYLIVSPKYWWEWGEGDHILERVRRGPGLAGGDPSAPTSTASFDASIICAAFDSSGTSAAVFADGRLHRVKPSELGDLVIEPIDLDLPEPASIDFDRAFGLHAISGTTAFLVDWHAAEVRSSVTLPAPGTAATVLDERVHVLMPELQSIAAVMHGGNGGRSGTTVLPLPPGVVADEESRLAMLPGGRLFLLTDGDLQPMRLGPNGLEAVQVAVPRNGQWRGVARAGQDLLCLVGNDGVVEVHQLGPKGFERVADHAFDGIETAANFLPSRGHVTLGSNELGPDYPAASDDGGTSIPDCPADLDLDGRVDSGDMGLLLGDWGSSHSRADLDLDGDVNAADLGLLLSHFGDCP